jgi:hypothetical protein
MYRVQITQTILYGRDGDVHLRFYGRWQLPCVRKIHACFGDDDYLVEMYVSWRSSPNLAKFTGLYNGEISARQSHCSVIAPVLLKQA